MPTYDYECKDCGPFEAFKRMSARDEATACPRCGVPSERVLAGTRIALLGDGVARERAAAEGSYARMRHRGGCSCC
jgi:putative FmdB family regulatory protein